MNKLIDHPYCTSANARIAETLKVINCVVTMLDLHDSSIGADGDNANGEAHDFQY